MSDELATTTCTIEGLSFIRDDDGGLRVRDLNYGQWLGHRRPRDIRKTIGRLEKAGKLPGLLARDERSRARNRHGTWTERTDRVYLLNQANCVKVAFYSDTPKGDLMVDEAVRLWLLASNGALPTNATAALAVVDAASAIVRQVEEILLSRSHVRDNHFAQRELDAMIRATSQACGESWQKTHGAIRKAFTVPTYRALTLKEVSKAMAFLTDRRGGKHLRLAARQLQLTLWPMDA